MFWTKAANIQMIFWLAGSSIIPAIVLLATQKPDIIVFVRTPSNLKSGQGNGLAWSRRSVTQQAHKTKPAVVAQKQASILCWLTTHDWKVEWPHHMMSRTLHVVARGWKWLLVQKLHFSSSNTFFLFSKYLLFLFQSQLLWLFVEVLAKSFLQGKLYLPKQITAKLPATTQNLCDYETVDRLRIPETRMLVVTLWATYGNDLCDVWRCRALFQITYCSPFIPDAKKHSNHPATQPRCRLIQVCQKSRRTTARSWAQDPGKKLIACVFGCLCGDCLGV